MTDMAPAAVMPLLPNWLLPVRTAHVNGIVAVWGGPAFDAQREGARKPGGTARILAEPRSGPMAQDAVPLLRRYKVQRRPFGCVG